MEYVLPDWPVVDFHVHFPVKTLEVPGDSPAQRVWRKAWAFPEPEPYNDDWRLSARRWQEEAEHYNLDRVVFVTGGGNEQLHEIVDYNPEKFIGFAHHHPQQPGAAEVLERYITEFGFRGYKILAPTLEIPIADKGFKGIWEVAERHQIPVLIHFGILGGAGGIAAGVNISPLSLHDVAKGYPGIPFVIPHFGCGYPRELLHLCWVCSNVYVDTSGNNEWVRWMPYNLTLEDLFRKFYETLGPKRIIFGSDSEWFPRGFAVRYLLDQLRACYQLRLPEEDIRKIFRENARNLLKLR